MSGIWREEQTTKFVNVYKDSENLWNVFTPEYKNREAGLASLEHMVQEMNMPNRSRPVELVCCLSNSWHHVNNNGQSNCLSSSCRPVGNPATVKLASQ
jgi:hypothetical protein